MSCLTLDSGAEQAVADVSPSEVHPEDGERDGEKTGGDDPEGAAGVGEAAGSEGGDGEADDEGEGGAGEGKAGGVEAEVGGGPGEGEGG